MGMTIDEKFKILQDEYTHLMGKYQLMQADYENRLKADLKAILVELQLEIDEKATELCDDGWWLTYNDIIQQKIDKLKENKDNEYFSKSNR